MFVCNRVVVGQNKKLQVKEKCITERLKRGRDTIVHVRLKIHHHMNGHTFRHAPPAPSHTAPCICTNGFRYYMTDKQHKQLHTEACKCHRNYTRMPLPLFIDLLLNSDLLLANRSENEKN